MKIYKGFEGYKKLSKPIVTAGTFDGVHLAHQKIIERIKDIAEKNNGESIVITYWPHPRFVLSSSKDQLKLLNTLEEKIELLKQFDINQLIIIPFTKEFSQITSKEYIENILIEKIGVYKLVAGYNHHFGKNREGTFEYLKTNARQFGFEVEEIPQQEINDVSISSTKIREALQCGDISTANACLGYEYFICAHAVKTNHSDYSSGNMTITLEVADKSKLIPAFGFYKGTIQFQEKIYQVELHIKTQQVSNVIHQKMELCIFNFTRKIYGEVVKIKLISCIHKE